MENKNLKYSKNYVENDQAEGKCFKVYDNGFFSRAYRCRDDNFRIPFGVYETKLIFNVSEEIITDELIDIWQFYEKRNGMPPGNLDAKNLLITNALVFHFPFGYQETNDEVISRFFQTEFVPCKLKKIVGPHLN